jgi:uncharacterized membrane protein YdjX (TVP38/TMEM64 family)
MRDESPVQNPRRARRWFAILRWAGAVLCLATVAAGVTLLPLAQYFKWLLEWTEGLGFWGPVLLLVVYVAVCLLFLPSSILTLGAGFLFGAIWGAAIASLGATLGAAAAFLVARGVLRGRIEHRLATHPKFRRLDRAIGDQGFQIVVLARLCSFFPYDLTSYLLGLTNITLVRYVLATWLGRLPETVMFAYLGSTAKNIADLAAGRVAFGTAPQVLLVLGAVAMVAIVIVMASVARRALRDTVGDSVARDKD